MALHDLGNEGQLLLDALERVVRLGRQLELDEDEQRPPQGARIHPRVVAGDHPLALQAAHALGARGGRQADAVGELGHGQAPILLQDVDDFQVDTVEFAHFTEPEGKRGRQWILSLYKQCN